MKYRFLDVASIVIPIIGLLLFALGMDRLYELPRVGERTAQWTLLAGLVVCSGLLILLVSPGAYRLLGMMLSPVRRYGICAVGGFALMAFVGFSAAGHYVLQGFPNSADEYAFVLQADTYAQGRLWADPPEVPEAFRQYRFFAVGDKWVSQYPPGWAMVLAPAAVLGLPLFAITALLGAATLFVFFLLARLNVSMQTAWAATIILGTSAFYMLNSASFFSHSLASFWGVLFALMGLLYLVRGNYWYALAAGACLGLMGLTRTHNAVIFLLPFVVSLAMTSGRRIGLIWLTLGGLPFLLALLAYNHQITGHPLAGVASPNEGELFGVAAAKSLELTVRRLRELIVWTSPILVFGYVVALWHVFAKQRACFTDWIMPVTLLFFLFYFGDGGNQYGPRYYFEAWPFALLTIAKAADPFVASFERTHGEWIVAATLAGLLFQIGVLPARFEREHDVIEERQTIYRDVRRAGLKNSIVLIASKVGHIRPMPPRDLVRNGLDVKDQDIIYALDLGKWNRDLLAHYPGRQLFRYYKGDLVPTNVE
jgi:hypothetical protein